MTKILAGIVTYNPDISKLRENVAAVSPQVHQVVLVDNGSDNVDSVAEICDEDPNVSLIRNGENLGVAKALNIIFRRGGSIGAGWVLTLDQDSRVDDNFIEECSPLMQKEDVVSISTLRKNRGIDRRTEYDENISVQTVNHCITSGNLVRLSAWKEIRGFNEALFIDCVDYEFCYRLRMAGYAIHRINKVLLTHEVGQREERMFFGKKILTNNYSPMRRYYISRNSIYLRRFIPLSHETGAFWGGYTKDHIIKVLLYETNKLRKLRACLQGIVDGMRMKEYDFPPENVSINTDEGLVSRRCKAIER